MLVCARCGKGKHIIAYSRHARGHGILGTWRLRAPIHKRVQKPNLHTFKGKKYCTKCLRIVKEKVVYSTRPTAVA